MVVKHLNTEIRLSIEHAQRGIEHYFNTVLFRETVKVQEVIWEGKSGQFRVVLKDEVKRD